METSPDIRGDLGDTTTLPSPAAVPLEPSPCLLRLNTSSGSSIGRPSGVLPRTRADSLRTVCAVLAAAAVRMAAIDKAGATKQI